MSISTKKGDSGFTSLYSGERVQKFALRVEAYGTIDELDAHLQEAKLYANNSDIIENIQLVLKRVMAELASDKKQFNNPINEVEVNYLTDIVHKLESGYNFDGFTISAKNIYAAKLNICRTIARRAERRIVELSTIEDVSGYILQYMNRLSDALFLLD